ncbi:tetratricopeptide repeat protein [Spirochaetia bacterium 38H-sp]|uniref:Tetratricopeptide repeat protein n=1 Tax=Rarispira pelagica TaxID=3141764 RepID=A0ABU9UAU1_9SPIR
MRVSRAFLLLLLVFSVFACKSEPPKVPENISQAELIQRAQEAFDNSDYELAIYYYQTLLDRYGNDMEARATSEYEIAHIYFLQGNYKKAEELFNKIISYYDGEQAASLPAWIKVLSVRQLKESIEKQAQLEKEQTNKQ